MVKIKINGPPRGDNSIQHELNKLKMNDSTKSNVSYEILEVYDTEENTDETEVQESGAVETEYNNLVNIIDICETVEEQIVRTSSNSSSNRSSISDKSHYTPRKSDDVREIKLSSIEIGSSDSFKTPSKHLSSGIQNISICLNNDVINNETDDVFSLTSTPIKDSSQKSFTTWNYHRINSDLPSPGYKETSSIEIIPSSPRSSSVPTSPRSPRGEVSFFNTSNNLQRSYMIQPKDSLSPNGIQRSYTTNSSILYGKKNAEQPAFKRSASCNDTILPRRKKTLLDDYVIIELDSDKVQWRDYNQTGVYLNLNLQPKFTHHLI